MHGVRGFFRFAHIDGLISSDPTVYARLPKIHTDESRTQGLDRLELRAARAVAAAAARAVELVGTAAAVPPVRADPAQRGLGRRRETWYRENR
jgi:hypothetical protein